MAETDEEQIEALKKWWDENGTSLLTGLVVVFGGFFGYQAWENSVRETGEAASGVYEDLVEASNNIVAGSADDAMTSTARNLAETLKTEYGESTYALFAGLHMARIAVEADDLDSAASELRWVLEQNPDPRLEAIVKMRLARVLLAAGDTEAALATLEGEAQNTAQISSWEEVRGDIYLAAGEHSKARESYQLALDRMDDQIGKPILEVKLADIPADTIIETQEEATEESEEPQ